MPKITDYDMQNSTYRTFIHESIRDLKNNGRTFVFRKYQVDDIIKAFPNDIITSEYIDNYYILKLKSRKEVANG